MVINSQCVISGVDMVARADAMAEAGADYELVVSGSDRLRLPVQTQLSAALVDVDGGVVDVDAVRDFLPARVVESVISEPVRELAITPAGTVKVTAAPTVKEYDSLVLAAGVNTTYLAAQVGIYTPSTIAHHVRFTFRTADRDWQSWVDKPAGGFGTYQHRARPGLWAIGGNIDPAFERWEIGKEGTIAASREAVLDYVKKHLTVEPTIVESLYCTKVPDLGDGVQFRRNGPVVTVYGDNLMKFAPVLGDALAEAVVTKSTPTAADLARVPAA